VDLLELCLTSTSSTDYYQLPKDRKCSHGFSSVANIYMEEFEQLALNPYGDAHARHNYDIRYRNTHP